MLRVQPKSISVSDGVNSYYLGGDSLLASATNQFEYFVVRPKVISLEVLVLNLLKLVNENLKESFSPNKINERFSIFSSYFKLMKI